MSLFGSPIHSLNSATSGELVKLAVTTPITRLKLARPRLDSRIYRNEPRRFSFDDILLTALC